MQKLTSVEGQVIYRQGTRFSLLFVVLIPVAVGAKIWLDIGWLPVFVLSFMGLVMLFVGAMREQLVFDPASRTITCTRSFFWRQLRNEVIPFEHVTGIGVGTNFERDKSRGPVHESGWRMSIDWKGDWGGGGMQLAVFYDAEETMREASELARMIGTRVTGAPKLS